MIRCNEFDEGLTDFLDGKGKAGQKREMQNHLDSCSTCRKMYDRYVLLVRKLRENPEIPCPDSVVQRVFFKVQNESPHARVPVGKAQKFFSHSVWTHSWKAAAAVTAAVLIYTLARDITPTRHQEFSDAEVMKARQQVELALGYFHHYAERTESVLKENVFRQGIQKPIQAGIKKTIGRF